MLLDPGAPSQGKHDLPVEPPGRLEVNVFEGSGIAELGDTESAGELPLLPSRPLRIDEQTETVLEAKIGILAGTLLLLERIDHGRELHGLHLLKGGLVQHEVSWVA
jgi:hypothetical protein